MSSVTLWEQNVEKRCLKNALLYAITSGCCWNRYLIQVSWCSWPRGSPEPHNPQTALVHILTPGPAAVPHTLLLLNNLPQTSLNKGKKKVTKKASKGSCLSMSLILRHYQHLHRLANWVLGSQYNSLLFLTPFNFHIFMSLKQGMRLFYLFPRPQQPCRPSTQLTPLSASLALHKARWWADQGMGVASEKPPLLQQPSLPQNVFSFVFFFSSKKVNQTGSLNREAAIALEQWMQRLLCLKGASEW